MNFCIDSQIFMHGINIFYDFHFVNSLGTVLNEFPKNANSLRTVPSEL